MSTERRRRADSHRNSDKGARASGLRESKVHRFSSVWSTRSGKRAPKANPGEVVPAFLEAVAAVTTPQKRHKPELRPNHYPLSGPARAVLPDLSRHVCSHVSPAPVRQQAILNAAVRHQVDQREEVGHRLLVRAPVMFRRECS
jgi:hypothetical protein